MDGRNYYRVSFMIYHVVPAHEWNQQIGQDHFAPTAFAQEGFIHCCRLAQLAGVIERYYQGQTDLLLLCIDVDSLTSRLLYEEATDQELFPHIYGTINKNAITRVEKIA